MTPVTDTQLIAAFRPDWERLGIVASRLGIRHGNLIAKRSQGLRNRGVIESKFSGACLLWRLTPAYEDSPSNDLAPPPPPPKLTPYCPPVELEGPHTGLVEQLAQRLWRKARSFSLKPVNQLEEWDGRPEWVKTAWRDVAHDALTMMFDLGFSGPAGQPDPSRFAGLSYAWNYPASGWEILDGEGGYVALVNEAADLEVMLAAPGMRSSIKALLAAIPADHPARQMAELQALEASLPENRKDSGQ